jgi:hypothetical protein
MEDFFVDEVLGKHAEAPKQRMHFKKVQAKEDSDDEESMPSLENKGDGESSDDSLVHYPARHNGWDFLAENKDEDDSDGEDDDCPPLLHPSKRKRGYESKSDGDSEMELNNGEDDLDVKAKPIPASIDLCDDDDEDIVMVNSVNSVTWNDQHSDEEWLVDSGATVNVTRSDEFLENGTVCTQTITVGNGEKVRALTQGDLTLRENNTGLKITIQAMVCKEFWLKTS